MSDASTGFICILIGSVLIYIVTVVALRPTAAPALSIVLAALGDAVAKALSALRGGRPTDR